jgi:predicted RNase H-like nuclease (RuvC/YqgF family)
MFKTTPLRKETEHQFEPTVNSTLIQTKPEMQSMNPKIVVDPVESLPKNRQHIDSSYLSAPKKHSKRSKSKSREQIKSLQKDLRNCSNQVSLYKENQFTLDTIIHYLRKEVRNLKHKLMEQAKTIEEFARENRFNATI